MRSVLSRFSPTSLSQLSLSSRLPRATQITRTRTFVNSTNTSSPLAQRREEEDMPAPMRTEAQWADFGREHISQGLGRLLDHVIVKGQGLELTTAEGRRFLDFTAGIGVTNLGQ